MLNYQRVLDFLGIPVDQSDHAKVLSVAWPGLCCHPHSSNDQGWQTLARTKHTWCCRSRQIGGIHNFQYTDEHGWRCVPNFGCEQPETLEIGNQRNPPRVACPLASNLLGWPLSASSVNLRQPAPRKWRSHGSDLWYRNPKIKSDHSQKKLFFQTPKKNGVPCEIQRCTPFPALCPHKKPPQWQSWDPKMNISHAFHRGFWGLLYLLLGSEDSSNVGHNRCRAFPRHGLQSSHCGRDVLLTL